MFHVEHESCSVGGYSSPSMVYCRPREPACSTWNSEHRLAGSNNSPFDAVPPPGRTQCVESCTQARNHQLNGLPAHFMDQPKQAVRV